VLGALSYAAATPPVAFTLGLMVVVSLVVLNFNVIVPLVARDVLNLDAHGFGLLMSSLGAGAVAGAFGVALLRRGQPPLAFLVASGATLCAGLVALALVGHFGLAAAVLALLGCCQILFTTGCNTTLQLMAPNELRGRVMGLYTVTFAGMTPFGSLLIGYVAEHQGIRAACAAGGAIGLLGIAVLVLVAHRSRIVWSHGPAV
jgi:predicted MFS family arabinose efflux permease